MTFLPQSDVPGLQIATEPGKWRDVPYVANSFVVNTGDTLHRWVMGVIFRRHTALCRRLANTDTPSRFLGPHLDTEIACLPSCTDNENPPKYAPTTYSDFMTWWYDANYNAADQDDLAVVNS